MNKALLLRKQKRLKEWDRYFHFEVQCTQLKKTISEFLNQYRRRLLELWEGEEGPGKNETDTVLTDLERRIEQLFEESRVTTVPKGYTQF